MLGTRILKWRSILLRPLPFSVLGLILLAAVSLGSFQNCSKSSGSGAVSSSSAGLPSGLTCTLGKYVSCPVLNGVGAKLCGSADSTCQIVTCNSGFQLLSGASGGASGGSCAPGACAAGAVATCQLAHGSGQMACGTNQTYGVCQASSCDSGYTLDANSNSCAAQTCSPGDSQACAIANGNGQQICQASSSWGACSVVTCASGFQNVSNACQANNSAPSAGNGSSSCTAGSQSPCDVPNGSGQATCTAFGIYGSCQAQSCKSGYTLANGLCTQPVCLVGSNQSCQVANGSGTQSCTSAGTWGSCTVTTCQSTYSLVNGACVVPTCTPGSQASCAVANGSGTKACNGQGTGYAACQIASCNSGFDLISGVCVASTPPPTTSSNGSSPDTTPTTPSQPPNEISNVTAPISIMGDAFVLQPVSDFVSDFQTALAKAASQTKAGQTAPTAAAIIGTLDSGADLIIGPSLSGFDFNVNTYATVSADVTVNGNLQITGLLYVASGVTLTVIGQLELGPNAASPGILYVEKGATVVFKTTKFYLPPIAPYGYGELYAPGTLKTVAP